MVKYTNTPKFWNLSIYLVLKWNYLYYCYVKQRSCMKQILLLVVYMYLHHGISPLTTDEKRAAVKIIGSNRPGNVIVALF